MAVHLPGQYDRCGHQIHLSVGQGTAGTKCTDVPNLVSNTVYAHSDCFMLLFYRRERAVWVHIYDSEVSTG